MKLLIVVIACVVVLAGCSQAENEASPPAQNSPGNGAPEPEKLAGVPMPEDFAVSVGSGGGFTGEWNWKHIAADGKVRHDETAGGKVDRAAREAVWHALQTLLTADFKRGPDNMTSAVKYTADGKGGYLDTPYFPEEGPFADFTKAFNRAFESAKQ